MAFRSIVPSPFQLHVPSHPLSNDRSACVVGAKSRIPGVFIYIHTVFRSNEIE